jgi:hypothetical protein
MRASGCARSARARPRADPQPLGAAVAEFLWQTLAAASYAMLGPSLAPGAAAAAPGHLRLQGLGAYGDLRAPLQTRDFLHGPPHEIRIRIPSQGRVAALPGPARERGIPCLHLLR